jgi:hypothetical protein
MKLSDSFFTRLSIISVLFVPGHLFDWAIEWLWLGFQLAASLILFFTFHGKLKSTVGLNPKFWTYCFVLFTLMGLLGTLHGHVILGLQIDVKDLQDHFRFLIFIILALFIGSAVVDDDIIFFTSAVKMVVIYNLLASAAILFDLPILSEALMLLYADAKVQVDFLHVRIGIPFGNPNFAAFFFLFAFAYFTSFRASPIFAILSIVSLLLTGSRSGIISILPLILLSYFYILQSAVKNLKELTVCVAFHAVFLSFSEGVFQLATSLPRFIELADALSLGGVDKVDTASIRINVVNDAIKYIELSPFIGIGPGRYYGLDITDSQLIAWPLMYGIPAAVLIIGFFALLFFNIIRNATTNRHALGSLAMLSTFLLMLSVGDFMKNYRLFFISILFLHIMSLIAAKRQYVTKQIN